MGAPTFLQASLLLGAYDTGYAFPNARIAHATSDSPLPVGIWRSVAHSQNAFFTESFMDEAAAAAGHDRWHFEADVDSAMSGNLCHCRTYPRIRAAIHVAAGS